MHSSVPTYVRTYVLCGNDFYCVCFLYLASLMITNNPMNVTVCSGANAIVSCGFTGANPSSTLPNWSWRIIKRNNDGDVISNETVRVLDINDNNTDGLTFFFVTTTMNGIRNANNSYLSVGPVDDTYNNTSYQCIFTINDSIIESETAGTVIVAGTYIFACFMIFPIKCSSFNPCTYLLL